MNWKRLQRQIEELRRRTPKYRVPLPDLSYEVRGAPLSNVISIPGSWTGRRQPASGSKTFAVGHSHKQGFELLTPAMQKNDLRWMGGAKT
jgi:hypothetical protein